MKRLSIVPLWLFALLFSPLSYAQYKCTSSPCLTVSSQGWIVGEIRTFAFSADAAQPILQELMAKGWVECAGQTLSRQSFPTLFKAIGDTWGSGDGRTDFYLPDLRGQTLRGWNHYGSQKQTAAFGGDPDFGARTAPRPEIAAPGAKGNIGDNAGSVQAGLVGTHVHTTTGYGGRGIHDAQFGNGIDMLANFDNASFDTGGVKGSPKENRVNNVYVMYAIYVGAPVTPNANTGMLVRKTSAKPKE